MLRSNKSNSGWGIGVGSIVDWDCEGRSIIKTRRGEEETQKDHTGVIL